MLTVSYNESNHKLCRDKIHKKLELCFESNCQCDKQAGFTTFALSIVDNLYLLQEHKWNTINVQPCCD